MDEIKLKPCPFCGGEADINVDHEAIEDTENATGRIPWYAIGAAQHLGLHICQKKRVKPGIGGLSMAKAVLISIRPEWRNGNGFT